MPPIAHRPRWWTGRLTLGLYVMCAILPLLLPAVPPLVDLPGHMGRYRVELDAGHAVLAQFYAFHWQLIGNLGVDLLIVPMSHVFGLELGVKLIVIAIPALTVAGLMWIAHEVHGRVPPTALFALPLAYGHPFLFGFVNFTLAMALALNAFALWLRLGRLGRVRARAWLFVPIACVLWLTHAFGWGVFGILAACAELMRQRGIGRSWWRALSGSVMNMLPLTPPLVLMAVWRSGTVDSATFGWLDWSAKGFALTAILRDRYQVYDIASVAVIAAVPVVAILSWRFKASWMLALCTAALALVFVVMPKTVFGSAYADMRLAPYVLAFAVLVVTPKATAGRHMTSAVAIAGAAFLALRTTTTTFSLYDSGASQLRSMAALDHVPVGARLISFVGQPCRPTWMLNRDWHLAGMAIVRRRAFSNEQWAIAGSSPMTVAKADAPGYISDPSQMVVDAQCPRAINHIDTMLVRLPRNAFDYLWLIHPPSYDAAGTRDMEPIWADRSDRLYRIVHR